MLEGDSNMHTTMHQHARSYRMDRNDHKKRAEEVRFSADDTLLYIHLQLINECEEEKRSQREHDGFKSFYCCCTMNNCLDILQNRTSVSI